MSTSTINKTKTILPPLETAFNYNPIIPENRIYYQSKISNTALSINALIAAASPLFLLSTRLSHLTILSDSNRQKLFQDLQHEIKAFENKAKAQHYRSESILIARYLLCAFLDELILFSQWGQKNSPDFESIAVRSLPSRSFGRALFRPLSG